nr:trypsin-like peptidase domain-containing protein [Actinomycetota bacterium]
RPRGVRIYINVNSEAMRSGALAVVALVAAALGAGLALVVATSSGWIDADEGVRTVILPRITDTAGSPAADPQGAAVPLTGNSFDPARIYATRSSGVVTLYSYFSGGERAQGSGFVVSRDGHVLTNSHVVTNAGGESDDVRGASRVYAVFADGDRIPAKIVGWDLFNDSGLVKVDPEQHALLPLPLGDSSRVVVGQPVAAIGSPFGNQNSLSVGVVSATQRSIDSLTSAYDVSGAIQVDAPINHGNSGGPLLDARGRVIGINAQIRSTSGNAEGVGFAIPINSARRSMEQLIATGRVAYAYVGITTQDVTPALARRYGLAARRGALIQTVVRGAPAERAGLRGSSRGEVFNGVPINLGGDLIVSFAGERVDRAADVARIVTDRLAPGQTVPLTVVRGGTGKREIVRLRLAERPPNPPR